MKKLLMASAAAAAAAAVPTLDQVIVGIEAAEAKLHQVHVKHFDTRW